MEIKVEDKGSYFLVEVIEDSKTEHKVTLNEEDYERLSEGKCSKEDLIKKSFEFLLEREPKESILREFNLTLISKYFSEYEEEIKKRI